MAKKRENAGKPPFWGFWPVLGPPDPVSRGGFTSTPRAGALSPAGAGGGSPAPGGVRRSGPPLGLVRRPASWLRGYLTSTGKDNINKNENLDIALHCHSCIPLLAPSRPGAAWSVSATWRRGNSSRGPGSGGPSGEVQPGFPGIPQNHPSQAGPETGYRAPPRGVDVKPHPAGFPGSSNPDFLAVLRILAIFGQISPF